MSRTAAFKRLMTFKEEGIPDLLLKTVAVLPNHQPLKAALQRLDASIEDYIDHMPALPKSPSPRRPSSRTKGNENVVLEMSHPMEGRLGGMRRTYRKRNQSRRRRQ